MVPSQHVCDCGEILAARFKETRVLRLTDPEAVCYRQVAYDLRFNNLRVGRPQSVDRQSQPRIGFEPQRSLEMREGLRQPSREP